MSCPFDVLITDRLKLALRAALVWCWTPLARCSCAARHGPAEAGSTAREKT